MQLICPVNQRKGNIMRWRTCTLFCMCVCWSSLLAAQRLNYEGGSSMGSAECIWKAPLAAAKRSWMISEHSSQARCSCLESLTICWCNYKGSTVGPAGIELTTSRMITRCSTNWATGTRCHSIFSHFNSSNILASQNYQYKISSPSRVKIRPQKGLKSCTRS